MSVEKTEWLKLIKCSTALHFIGDSIQKKNFVYIKKRLNLSAYKFFKSSKL